MQVNIASDFSVYDLLKRVQKESNLLHHRRTMNLISYEIENATLIDGAATRIFASFQRMSRFLPQVERYRRLAQTAESVYVFGVPDVQPPQIENITYIALKRTDRLAKEWFLVSYGVDYASALATEELSDIDDPDDQRQFKGIWTFDLGLVSIMEQWLTSTVGAPILLLDESRHNRQRQLEIVRNSEQRILPKINAVPNTAMDAQIQSELKLLVDNGVYT